MWEILQKLVDEDPCLKVEHVAATNETIVNGLGDLHLRILLERLRDVHKFGNWLRGRRARPTAETITGKAEATIATKQTGGADQFGECSCGSSRCRAVASSSPTRSGAGRSRTPSSRQWKRVCARRWPPA